MKDFIFEKLSVSQFEFAKQDYYDMITSFYDPTLFAFVYEGGDMIKDIETLIAMSDVCGCDVIIIDIRVAAENMIEKIMRFLEGLGYVNLDSYEDRLCFGRVVDF